MATPQIGDLVKFAELGWKVYQYGWTDELNASRQYNEFGNDVKHLAKSLQDLSDIINNARGSFRNHGLLPPDNLGWDEFTLFDIIGDYQATLNECIRLINTNRSYLATTGPVANVVWNVMVQPTVEKLRSRILLHNSKIEHVLRPFEADLRLRIHSDLVRRIEGVRDDVRGVHNDVRRMRNELQAMMRALELDHAIDPVSEPDVHRVSISDDKRQVLEVAFVEWESDGYDYPPLRDLADAFIRNFDTSTRCFQPESGWSCPPEAQYWALLTSQFLMDKMLESPEFRSEPPDISHWPRYLHRLQQQLSAECQRFNQHMVTPVIAGSVPPIWPREELPAYIESAKLPVKMEHLLELNLETHTPRRWRRLKLLRYSDGTDRRFRLIITAGDRDGERDKAATETRPIDFDLSTACLIPRYASFNGGEPLEMVLRASGEMHPLVFLSRPDLLKFQQALTGYEVVDNYIAYRLQVVFVLGSNQRVKEFASLQLWRPMRLEGERVMNDADASGGPYSSDDSRRYSTASSVETVHPLRPASDPIPPSHSESPWLQSPIQTQSSPLLQAQIQRGPTSNRTMSQTYYGGYDDPHQPPYSANGIPIRNVLSPASMGSASASTSLTSTIRPRFWRKSPTSPKPDRSVAGSVLSSFSTASHATKPISVSGGANVASTGTLHCKPTEPFLVLFTQNFETSIHGIVAVSLDQKTAANYKACECMSNPNCCIAALERGAGGDGPLKVIRLGGSPKTVTRWDLLPLSEPLRDQRASRASRAGKTWRKVIRISMCFERVDLRKELAGWPCNCTTTTEGQLMDCLNKWHRGRLGLVKEISRRERAEWYKMRYQNLVHVEDRRQLPGARQDWA
ncbi:hypothetical protein B0H63DRAFT_475150 [Podospora didyma]|uniref:Fungal N-terminal domain-containing protein n=1 Tax=Podospora didyma TaxID=330526 RepID=A0AAE0NGV5_9PEZI|nr:hypothetical protein B0H63DRAFT_475150 [Podospora didyma]